MVWGPWVEKLRCSYSLDARPSRFARSRPCRGSSGRGSCWDRGGGGLISRCCLFQSPLGSSRGPSRGAGADRRGRPGWRPRRPTWPYRPRCGSNRRSPARSGAGQGGAQGLGFWAASRAASRSPRDSRESDNCGPEERVLGRQLHRALGCSSGLFDLEATLMGIGQRGLGGGEPWGQAGPRLGQAKCIVLMVAHQRDDRAQGGSPADLGSAPLGRRDRPRPSRPGDAQQQPGRSRK